MEGVHRKRALGARATDTQRARAFTQWLWAWTPLVESIPPRSLKQLPSWHLGVSEILETYGAQKPFPWDHRRRSRRERALAVSVWGMTSLVLTSGAPHLLGLGTESLRYAVESEWGVLCLTLVDAGGIRGDPVVASWDPADWQDFEAWLAGVFESVWHSAPHRNCEVTDFAVHQLSCAARRTRETDRALVHPSKFGGHAEIAGAPDGQENRPPGLLGVR